MVSHTVEEACTSRFLSALWLRCVASAFICIVISFDYVANCIGYVAISFSYVANCMSYDANLLGCVIGLFLCVVNLFDDRLIERFWRTRTLDNYQASYYIISSHTTRHIQHSQRVWFQRLKLITLPRELVVREQ